MKNKKNETVSLSELLFNAMEMVADLDVKNPDFMKEIVKARTLAELADTAIKRQVANAALRKLNNSMLAEPKPLKLLAR
jgi:hypothetical protein